MKRLLKQAKQCYENKKNFKSRHEIDIENCLVKKKIYREYGRNRYQNISENYKQILKEYKTIYLIKNFLFGKEKYLLLHSKSISSAKLNTKLCGSDVFLLFELINIA